MVKGKGKIITPTGCVIQTLGGSILPHNFGTNQDMSNYQTIHVPEGHNMDSKATAAQNFIRKYTKHTQDTLDVAIESGKQVANKTAELLMIITIIASTLIAILTTLLIYLTKCRRVIMVNARMTPPPPELPTLKQSTIFTTPPNPDAQKITNLLYQHQPPHNPEYDKHSINSMTSRKINRSHSIPSISSSIDRLSKHSFDSHNSYQNLATLKDNFQQNEQADFLQKVQPISYMPTESTSSTSTHIARQARGTLMTADLFEKLVPYLQNLQTASTTAEAKSQPYKQTRAQVSEDPLIEKHATRCGTKETRTNMGKHNEKKSGEILLSKNIKTVTYSSANPM
jgi:molecular chaperone GrpE (heat shock protein)